MERRGKRRLEGGDDDEEHQQHVRNRPALSSVINDARMVDFSSLGPLILGERGLDGRNLQLHFKSRLSLPLFTGGKVKGKQGAAIHVELKDANTGDVLTSGPESSVKLNVVVLEGEFNNEDEGWSRKEFDSHVVRERDGKSTLLTGDLQVTLKEGVGTIRDLTFTDNSMYKKHYPPALIDQVWRLEKIRKEGSFHKRLNDTGIYTVADFLRLVVRDSQELRNVDVDNWVKKAYDNWKQIVEYDGKTVLNFKQTEKSSTSQSDLHLVPVNYPRTSPRTSDNQLPPSRLPVSVPFGSSSMYQSMLIGDEK
ncbi:hypothetical protein BUALT_Bualt16G0100700 [Buddleja alternifolia]|uniref:Uncharacterized protein n=1 Tax=Buddleja alternifolia TaxID=168488 RepID=A0AAV6WC98_9LAMI|nr:hypothetical protein BUALT_Bualt16G0100700 [Buddleja alternifolia]